MTPSFLLQHLVFNATARDPDRIAVVFGHESISYAALDDGVRRFAVGLVSRCIGRGARVGIWLEKRIETVIASFGSAAAGCVFVPLNPLLKPDQVGYILRDCNVRALVTSPERLEILTGVIPQCNELRHVIITGVPGAATPPAVATTVAQVALHHWAEMLQQSNGATHRTIDTDVLAILYTSGSTGHPKGVVLSHRNMVAGAASVASYLENRPDDTILAALPLSFDAGFSQLTTAFHVGARVVLINYLLPRDVLNAVAKHRV